MVFGIASTKCCVYLKNRFYKLQQELEEVKKAVLITGASSGIGAATALEFSQKGYFVYLLARNKEALEQTASKCISGASLLKCDLAQDADIIKAAKHIQERPDTRLEVLVNNAGIFERIEATEETSLDSWRRQFEINFFGAVRMTQLILPIFLKQGFGSIVNVSSTLGLRPSGNTLAYSASKAAMNNWTQGLALSLGSKQIRVNSICPGLVDTPIHNFSKETPEKKAATLKELGPLQPLGRIGTPVEIAKSIYFLGASDSSWTTGAILSVDGGINLT